MPTFVTFCVLRVPSEQMPRRVPRPQRLSTYPRVDPPRDRLGVRLSFVKRNKKKIIVFTRQFSSHSFPHNDAT